MTEQNMKSETVFGQSKVTIEFTGSVFQQPTLDQLLEQIEGNIRALGFCPVGVLSFVEDKT